MKTRQIIRTRGITALLLAVALALLIVRPAQAQATLLHSTPSAGALLDMSPPSVTLEFSAEIDASFSQAQLLDSQDQLIEPGPGTVNPALPRTLRLILPDLAKGSYTAVWRVRSTADGAISTGRVPFGVGVVPSTSALIPLPGAPDPATLPPAPLESLARWLNLLAATIALGGLAFGLLVWRPAFRAATKEQDHFRMGILDFGLGRHGKIQNPKAPDSQPPDDTRSQNPNSKIQNLQSDAVITRHIQRMTQIGGGLFLLTNLFLLLTQAAGAANVSLAQAIGAPLIELLSGQSGLLALARMALIFQILVLAWRLPPIGSGPAQLWWSLLAVGGVALLTLSMTAHAAATPAAALAVALDWLHLAAAVVWLGGLLPVALVIRATQRNPDMAQLRALLLRRYAWLTAACVAILTLTGIYSYTLHIGQPDLLVATTYGRALLVKLGLFAALLLLGVLCMRFDRIRMRSVQAALISGALLLLAVAAMASVAPSTAAWEAHEQQGIAQSATVDNVDLALRIAPAQIGDNEFAVDVTDRRPGATAAATTVLLRFDMLGMPMDALQTKTQPAGSERYFARGSFTSMGGRWHIEVVLQRAGFADVKHTFEVDIVKGGPFVISQ